MALAHRAKHTLGTLCLVLALVGAACGSGDSNAETSADDVASADVSTSSGDAPEPTSPAGETESESPAADSSNEVAPAPADSTTSDTSTVDATAVPTTAAVTVEPTPTEPVPTAVVRPAAPSGRVAPAVASTAAGLAEQIAQAERGLAAPDSTAEERAQWGHLHQVAIRKLGYEPAWDAEFYEALPTEFQVRTVRHVAARRSLIDLSSGYSAADFIPAWEIVEPEPAENLLSYYQAAEAATGIDWEYLAAINLVETGMGRIRGLSSAGAQGPMQFLPTTWAEAGIGQGDINDPNDAINAAARYLVRRGGPADMRGAIFGYNNSDNYVDAVQTYAAVLRDDPAAYTAIYNWEIYFYTEAGDIWLPAGFRSEESVDLYEFLDDNPWSAPDPGLR